MRAGIGSELDDVTLAPVISEHTKNIVKKQERRGSIADRLQAWGQNHKRGDGDATLADRKYKFGGDDPPAPPPPRPTRETRISRGGGPKAAHAHTAPPAAPSAEQEAAEEAERPSTEAEGAEGEAAAGGGRAAHVSGAPGSGGASERRMASGPGPWAAAAAAREGAPGRKGAPPPRAAKNPAAPRHATPPTAPPPSHAHAAAPSAAPSAAAGGGAEAAPAKPALPTKPPLIRRDSAARQAPGAARHPAVLPPVRMHSDEPERDVGELGDSFIDGYGERAADAALGAPDEEADRRPAQRGSSRLLAPGSPALKKHLGHQPSGAHAAAGAACGRVASRGGAAAEEAAPSDDDSNAEPAAYADDAAPPAAATPAAAQAPASRHPTSGGGFANGTGNKLRPPRTAARGGRHGAQHGAYPQSQQAAAQPQPQPLRSGLGNPARPRPFLPPQGGAKRPTGAQQGREADLLARAARRGAHREELPSERAVADEETDAVLSAAHEATLLNGDDDEYDAYDRLLEEQARRRAARPLDDSNSFLLDDDDDDDERQKAGGEREEAADNGAATGLEAEMEADDDEADEVMAWREAESALFGDHEAGAGVAGAQMGDKGRPPHAPLEVVADSPTSALKSPRHARRRQEEVAHDADADADADAEGDGDGDGVAGQLQSKLSAWADAFERQMVGEDEGASPPGAAASGAYHNAHDSAVRGGVALTPRTSAVVSAARASVDAVLGLPDPASVAAPPRDPLVHDYPPRESRESSHKGHTQPAASQPQPQMQMQTQTQTLQTPHSQPRLGKEPRSKGSNKPSQARGSPRAAASAAPHVRRFRRACAARPRACLLPFTAKPSVPPPRFVQVRISYAPPPPTPGREPMSLMQAAEEAAAEAAAAEAAAADAAEAAEVAAAERARGQIAAEDETRRRELAPSVAESAPSAAASALLAADAVQRETAAVAASNKAKADAVAARAETGKAKAEAAHAAAALEAMRARCEEMQRRYEESEAALERTRRAATEVSSRLLLMASGGF